TPPKNWADDGVDPPSSDPISGVSEGRRPEPIGENAVMPQQNLTVTSAPIGQTSNISPDKPLVSAPAVQQKMSYAAATAQNNSGPSRTATNSFDLAQRLNQNYAIRIESSNLQVPDKVILDALLVSSGGVRPKTFVKLPNGDYGLRMPDAESFNRLKDAVI